MAERLKLPNVGSLPKINTFKKVVEAAPVGPNTINPIKFWWITIHDFFSSENQIVKAFPEEGLDQMYELWHGFGQTEQRTKRLHTATQLDYLPELERNEAYEISVHNNTLVDNFRRNLMLFISGKYTDWTLADKAMQAAIQFEEVVDEPRENQITAFCEAVSEVSKEKQLTPEFVRQRIAQWALEEMFTEGAQYAALYLNTEYNDPTSLRDDTEMEKTEIKSALRKQLWDAETLRKKESEFKKLLARLYEDVYNPEDEEIIAFKELWSAAKGTKIKLKTVSALQLLSHQHDVFESLRANEIFDIQLTDEEAELDY